MHELGLADAVVDIAVEQSAGRRVTAVHARVSTLLAVEEGALELGFELASRGTVVEGARLVIEEVPARVLCHGCSTESETADHPLRCPACGGLGVEPLTDDVLVVHAIDIEEVAR